MASLTTRGRRALSWLNILDQTSRRLEVRASIMEAAAGRDLMAASLLLKLMVILGDVQEVETVPPGRRGVNDGQRPN
jgi:hypothetical protein